MAGFNNTIGFVERKYSKTEHDSIVGFITNAYGDTIDYVNRVNTAGGETLEPDDLFQVYNHLETNGQMDNLKLLYLSNTGMIQRVDGVLKFVRTAYDASENDNDLDGSVTASLQPRLVGGIAPNSKPAAANLNGEGRHFTHPEIHFNQNDAWSLSFVINLKGSNSELSQMYIYYAVGSARTYVLPNHSNNTFQCALGANGIVYNFTLVKGVSNYEKNTIYTLTADGLGNLTLYVNGVFAQTKNGASTEAWFRNVNNSNVWPCNGNFLLHKLQSGALTAQQVADEAALLRSLYPEIESVQIGTQTWSTRNFEAVATPEGNVIANVTENGAVEKVVNGGFDIDTSWTKGTGWGIASGKATGVNAVTSRIFQNSIFTSGKWYKITIDSVVRVGSLQIQNGSQVLFGIGAGTITTIRYIKANQSQDFSIYGVNNFDVDIDNVSVQELNWSNATEIYDAVYAATSGDAATKEYAALKEAAMWCYYNNDPDNGAIYGKLYNKAAEKLLTLDFLSSGFGWDIPTEAEKDTLETNSAASLKMTGSDYWAIDNGTNTTGFTLLPSGYRDIDGTFVGINEIGGFHDQGDDFLELGLPVRIIKD